MHLGVLCLSFIKASNQINKNIILNVFIFIMKLYEDEIVYGSEEKVKIQGNKILNDIFEKKIHKS